MKMIEDTLLNGYSKLMNANVVIGRQLLILAKNDTYVLVFFFSLYLILALSLFRSFASGPIASMLGSHEVSVKNAGDKPQS